MSREPIERILASPDFEKKVGQWIAVVGEDIVASGSNAKEVYDIAAKKHPKGEIFIAKFPKSENQLFEIPKEQK